MLQRAAAAMAKMRARRNGASFPGVQPFGDAAFASSASAGAEPRTHAIARHGEGQKHRRAVIFGDAVTARPDPLYDKLDDTIQWTSLHGHSLPGSQFRRNIPCLWNAGGDPTLTIEGGDRRGDR